MIFQQAITLADLASQHGVKRVFQCPGSRNAPLTLAFSRLGGFEQTAVMDERSAGYQAIGYSQVSLEPVIVHTTSGTAAANLLPSACEAFYAQVPIVFVTADRPSAWLDQRDGQMIRQTHVLASHVKGSFQLPENPDDATSIWHMNRIINEALLLATTAPKGPVHINIPFSEPLYPTSDETYEKGLPARKINQTFPKAKLEASQLHDFTEKWVKTTKRLIVIGQSDYHPDLRNALKALSYYTKTPILIEVTSNCHALEGDSFLWVQDYGVKKLHHEISYDQLRPDILITVGGALLSKPLRQMLRTTGAKSHWHLQEAGLWQDGLWHLTDVIFGDPIAFLTKLGEVSFFQTTDSKEFLDVWRGAAIPRPIPPLELHWSDAGIVRDFVAKLPDEGYLHIGNSMPIRYVQMAGFSNQQTHLVIFANRGASGIDGCLSTAVGAALARPDQNHYLLIGDMSLKYDRNGLFPGPCPANLKILVLNNRGGNIFRIIDGPRKQAELVKHFELDLGHNHHTFATEAGMQYFPVDAHATWSTAIDSWLHSPSPALLEVFTDPQSNAALFS